MSFTSLGLSEPILKAIQKIGYSVPSPIQQKAIPVILEGNDVLASAQTGTGKTAGFTLPILQQLSSKKGFRNRPVRALVLTPTRELAAQIYENVKLYSEFIDIKSTVIFGGVGQNPQVAILEKGVDVLIATPGRLLDLQNQGLLNLSSVEILVLDEADRMLDMGFKRDIDKIINLIPKKRQNLLFSATFSKEIKSLASSILHQPVMVEVTPENSTVEKIEQQTYAVAKNKKADLVVQLIKEGNWEQVLVFTRTKHGANKLCKKIETSGITAAAIHGNKSQTARTNALAGIKNGSVRVLVATDIAARGLDIPLLPYVMNYELPNIPEDYVHRIGRTGRAGASGLAVSLVSEDEVGYLSAIEKLIGLRLPSATIEGFEPDPNADTTPPASKQSQKNNRNPRSFRKTSKEGQKRGTQKTGYQSKRVSKNGNAKKRIHKDS